jgi:transcriptional regulator with XRE-family HTH domain
VSIGQRLREERDAQNLTQEALASALGITKKTQGLYERDERSPNADYLSAIQGLGLDVMYILTGQRMPRPAEGLSERESAVLDNFRSLPEEDRAAVQRLTNALAEQGRNVANSKKTG